MHHVPKSPPPPLMKQEDVLEAERQKVANRRADMGLHPDHGLAMALSGGGIRAAAFDAGVMWRLAHNGLLKDVDVVSNISGGGICGFAFATEVCC